MDGLGSGLIIDGDDSNSGAMVVDSSVGCQTWHSYAIRLRAGMYFLVQVQNLNNQNIMLLNNIQKRNTQLCKGKARNQ
jgi:hypothetical protein